MTKEERKRKIEKALDVDFTGMTRRKSKNMRSKQQNSLCSTKRRRITGGSCTREK
jgi:hypothetical protein